MTKGGSLRRRHLRALVVVPVTALLAGWGATAGAQSAPPGPATTTTTINGLQDLVTKLLGGGTTVPAAPAAQPAASSGSPPPAQDPGGGPAAPAVPGAAVAPDAHAVPPEAQAAIDSIKRTPGRNTDELLVALHQLVALGLGPEDAAVIGMGHFPVAGAANYSDDFLFPRFNPTFHPHQGNDIFAAEGTPVRAPEDGTVRYTDGAVSGKAFYLTTGNGTYYFGCHLVAYADLPTGSRVTQGQIVGYVGSTGDAAGGAPHLHFEVHPGGGVAVDPKATLDRWLDDALANVANLVAGYRQVGLPGPVSDTGVLRRFDEPLAGGSGIATLVAASSSNPGIRRLSELRAARRSTSDSAKADTASVEAWQAAEQTTHSLLAPLTPAALQTVLVHESG
ncbi:MAG: M23 family metallopeptidase [Acidimicrobiales bacterium]